MMFIKRWIILAVMSVSSVVICMQQPQKKGSASGQITVSEPATIIRKDRACCPGVKSCFAALFTIQLIGKFGK